MTETKKPEYRLLRLKQVIDKTGLCRTTIYAKISDGTFPRQVHLGPRIAAWLESDIDTWIELLIKQRDAKHA